MSTATEKKKSTKKKDKKQEYSKEQYLNWYELMLRIRRFEERALQMYGHKKSVVSAMSISGRKP